MVKSLLESRLGEPVQILIYTPNYDLDTETETPAWITGPVVKALVSSVNSGEAEEVGADVMNRRKLVRVFGTPAISGKDELVIRGETYRVDGIPNATQTPGGMPTTTIYAVKEGTAS